MACLVDNGGRHNMPGGQMPGGQMTVSTWTTGGQAMLSAANTGPVADAHNAAPPARA